MTLQRRRHANRQPVEETVRLSLSDFVGSSGVVESERHSYDWREDDLLIYIRLNQPIGISVLQLFRQEIAKRMSAMLPSGMPLHDWLVVIECNGETLGTVAWDDRDNLLDGYGT